MSKLNSIVMALALVMSPAILAAEEKDKMAPLARFVGGEWVVDGKWATGEPLHARSIYTWSLGKRIITAQTFVTSGGKEYQRYEGTMAFHPKKNSLYEVSFTYTGEISEILVEPVDSDTLHIGYSPFTPGEESKVRQILKFTGKDSFVWTVLINQNGEWKQLIEATWNRREK